MALFTNIQIKHKPPPFRAKDNVLEASKTNSPWPSIDSLSD